jgi:FixJ family two-component response regulator
MCTLDSTHSIGPVAVIDDDEAVLDSLRFSLGLDGFDVATYLNGAEFFAASPSISFCCVIVDQNMPDMTGLEVASRLRAIESKLPIIMLTGGLTDSLKSRALALGVNHVMVKSPREGDLAQAIRQIIGRPNQKK